ncbi:Rid family detoxifying hydrolase [Jatrophihabitans lederbergiae]|uniref:Carboxylic ester hydrolase n=1 Tax=Jatrophihabitans lederbergiae TaxID=3075547 RepID=A0ABU2JGG0_9ACTN|nr:Rid family detoxifying hydrolase [Jatrophihabitans sp. DSM 44399]MDT0264063.1 Rid family detoxifying hydrolase [Jatrophihabitans sp. DSM 44399]
MSSTVRRITTGLLEGVSEGAADVFRGIPYAATPIGHGRFAAPAPHPGWVDQPRDASRFGGTQPQARRGNFGALDMTPYFGPGWIAEGDNLTLNIWSPKAALDGLAPVLVYVHGGGFLGGAAQASLYGGDSFARDGVVFVSLSYRTGIAGFLRLPDAPDNRGLLDVVAALRWVQQEITVFGGDPRKVTLAGQSAGATLVAAVLAHEESSGLVQRAIVQSGSGRGALTQAQADVVTQRLARHLHVAPTADAFGDIDDATLIGALPALVGIDLRVGNHVDPLAGLTPFGPVLDEQPATAIARGVGARVNLLIGSNTEEGNLYLVPNGASDTTAESETIATAVSTLPRGSDPIGTVDKLRALHPAAPWGELRSAILTEAMFTTGTRALADAYAIRGSAVYEYQFAWRSPALGGRLGAAHTVELPFVFDRLDATDLQGDGALLGEGLPPQRLAARMHTAWVSFISGEQPGWSRSTAARRRLCVIVDGDQWELEDTARVLPLQSRLQPPAIGPYSPAVAAGGFVYVSGQLPLDPDTGRVVDGGVAAQTKQAITNIASVLGAAGLDLQAVIKTTVLLTDINDLTEVNDEYARHFNGTAPARAAYQVAALPQQARVEIEAVAILASP